MLLLHILLFLGVCVVSKLNFHYQNGRTFHNYFRVTNQRRVLSVLPHFTFRPSRGSRAHCSVKIVRMNDYNNNHNTHDNNKRGTFLWITYEIILRGFLSFSKKKKTQFLPFKKFDGNTVDRRVVKRLDSIYRGLTPLLFGWYRVEKRVLSRLIKKNIVENIRRTKCNFVLRLRPRSIVFFPFFPRAATKGCYFFNFISAADITPTVCDF